MSSNLSNKTSSEWIRYKDGLWIPYRKRTYLYWFKFLQEAERSDEHKVNWNKYRGWGGSKEILESRFDDWWTSHWKDLFAVETKGVDMTKTRFPLSTTQPKTEAIRISWLVWLHRNTPPDYAPNMSRYGGETYYPKRGSNNLAIARKIISLEKRNTYLSPINPDDINNRNEPKTIMSLVGRYKRRANKIVTNVCNGQFP